MMRRNRYILMTMFFSSLMLWTAEAAAETHYYDGVTVNLLTELSGTFISEPLKRHARQFEQMTGATVNIETVPFGELYQEIDRGFSGESQRQYDAIVFPPQWLVDFVRTGYLEDLTERVHADRAIQWRDIARFFREFSAKYHGRIYTIPLDGDFQMVFYRTDLLEKHNLLPPATWEDYLEIAGTLHGKDFNDDGQPDYGSCISKKPGEQGHWMFMSIAASFLQTKGTSQGVFFDVNTMKPLVNNEAFAAALEIYRNTSQYGPPDEFELDTGGTRQLFINGQCALTLDWGDIGTMAVLPESKVKNKVGAVILPGSPVVLDRESGKLTSCDESLCPYAINGINFAPYAAFGGWSGAIHAKSPARVKDAAYDFLSYVSQPNQSNKDVTDGTTGFNPYRVSQFARKELWLEIGMSKNAVRYYLGAISRSLNNPNMALDLRIPQNNRYQKDVLDNELYNFLLGKSRTEEVMANIEQQWEDITEQMGWETQLQAYRLSLGRQ